MEPHSISLNEKISDSQDERWKGIYRPESVGPYDCMRKSENLGPTRTKSRTEGFLVLLPESVPLNSITVIFLNVLEKD